MMSLFYTSHMLLQASSTQLCSLIACFVIPINLGALASTQCWALYIVKPLVDHLQHNICCVAEAADAVVAAVPALAHLLKASQLQTAAEERASQASAGDMPESHRTSLYHDHAALQLEALHVLLLLLPLPLPQVCLVLLQPGLPGAICAIASAAMRAF